MKTKPIERKLSLVAQTLNFGQVRILKVLSKLPDGRGMSRIELSQRAGITALSDSLGPINKEDVEATEKKSGRKTLLGLQYVAHTMDSLDGPPHYRITAAGKKALETLNNDPCWPFGH